MVVRRFIAAIGPLVIAGFLVVLALSSSPAVVGTALAKEHASLANQKPLRADGSMDPAILTARAKAEGYPVVPIAQCPLSNEAVQVGAEGVDLYACIPGS